MNSYYTELHGEGTEEHREITLLPPQRHTERSEVDVEELKVFIHPQRPARFTRSDIEGRVDILCFALSEPATSTQQLVTVLSKQKSRLTN